MKFATTRQVVLMIAVTAVLLYGLDYWKNPQLWHHDEDTVTHDQDRVQLTLWMNRECSTAELRQALSGVDGLDVQSAAVPASPESATYPGNAITVRVVDAEKVDFAAIDRGLRQTGLVAGRMELTGLPHLGLRADFPPLAGVKDQAVEERITFLKTQAMGQLEWLDSVNMDAQNHALTVYARYIEPGKSIDVAELVSGLNQAGLVPASLHVMVGDQHSMAAAK